jgi:hypothetical protein
MSGGAKNLCLAAKFDQIARVHNGDAVSHM